MMDVGRHPNIELLTLSEIEEITGYVGNFNVRVKRKARFVDEKECTACGDCVQVCPVFTPNEYEIGLNTRRAVYIPFPQAVPSAYVVNMDECLGNNPIACGKCMDACQKKAINFDMTDRMLDLHVGTIVVATGMSVYNPEELDEYGYTRFENVVTSMEMERLLNAGGPTGGHLIRPVDGREPKRIGFVLCVGSRSEKRGNPYCSNVCCMNTVKDSLLIKEHDHEAEVVVFYQDIRAFGKGFEDLYKRSKNEGVKYVRGLPGDIAENPETKNLVVTVENTLNSRLETYDLDMVVLSVGLVPHGSNGGGGDTLTKVLPLSRTSDGFYLEAHPKLKPVDAPTQGVFFAGCAESPKDVKDSVTQASAAAARAGILMAKGKVTVEAITATVDELMCTSCGVCAKVCPFGAITVDVKGKKPAVVIEAACLGCGTCAAECKFGAITQKNFTDDQINAQVDAATLVHPENNILAFCCNWCSYAGADAAGTGRMQYPANIRIIRTMCSGRVDEDFVWRGFERGAPIVWVTGCHIGDCHYIDANHWTLKRVEKMHKRMEKLGLRTDRLQLDWISAAEGNVFARRVRELQDVLRSVTTEEIAETQRILREEKEKKGKKGKTQH
jgi:heterodisulfide reductase subunit A